MTPRGRTVAAPVALVAIALAITACGSEGSDDAPPPATTAVAAPVPPPPSDAELAQRGRILVTDLGEGWRSDGQAEAPERSACPVPEIESLPPASHAVSDRFLEDPPPAGALPMTIVQHVYLLPTLAQANAAFDGQVSETHLGCLGTGLTQALQEIVADDGTVEASPWTDLAWPATGDRAVGVGLDLTIRYPDGSTRPVGFAFVVTQRGRGVSVLDVSWLRDEVPQQPLVRALGAAAGRLADARSAPDEHAV